MTLAINLVVVLNSAKLLTGATGLARRSAAWRVRMRLVAFTDLLRNGVQVQVEPILLDDAHTESPARLRVHDERSPILFCRPINRNSSARK
jgi:hypothetical protein